MDRQSLAFFGFVSIVLLTYIWLSVKYRLERGPGRRIGPVIRKVIAALGLAILVALVINELLR